MSTTRSALTEEDIRTLVKGATADERAAFDAGRDSMAMGWGSVLDKLAAYLGNAG